VASSCWVIWSVNMWNVGTFICLTEKLLLCKNVTKPTSMPHYAPQGVVFHPTHRRRKIFKSGPCTNEYNPPSPCWGSRLAFTYSQQILAYSSLVYRMSNLWLFTHLAYERHNIRTYIFPVFSEFLSVHPEYAAVSTCSFFFKVESDMSLCWVVFTYRLQKCR
jgi:hypothetical protein